MFALLLWSDCMILDECFDDETIFFVNCRLVVEYIQYCVFERVVYLIVKQGGEKVDKSCDFDRPNRSCDIGFRSYNNVVGTLG